MLLFAGANAHGQALQDLKQLSLEQLMAVDVTSVERTANPLSDTPAAVTVLTAEDIRRSGATNLPELLRYVPGVEVARKDSDHWSVAIRGFGSQFSKAVLILIDGRILYTPLFEGVFWDVQDVLFENIERVEVIRGPGGTIWGSNAFNGVINIITKNAKDTHGDLFAVRSGVVDRASGEVRYGGGDGDTFDYRIDSKAFNRGAEFHPDGLRYDQWRLHEGGFRLDGKLNRRDSWMLTGDLYGGTTGEAVSIASFTPQGQFAITGNDIVSGGNVLGGWRRSLDSGASLQVETYYDVTSRRAPHFEEHRGTFNINFLHHLSSWKRQNFVWGLEARVSPSRFTQTIPTLNFTPAQNNSSVYSAFLQDEFRVNQKTSLTFGSKVERNNYTGPEVQPSIRLLFKPNAKNTVWAAVSRSVRIPARTDEDVDLTIFAQPGVYVAAVGNRNLRPEELFSYEAGQRSILSSRLYVDVALFHNNYNRLVNIGGGSVSAQTSPIPYVLVTVPWVNGAKARTDGLEIAPDFRPTKWWDLKSSYSFVNIHAENKPGNTDTNSVLTFQGSSPKHMFSLQSIIDLPKRVEFDPAVRYVSGLRAQQVNGYVTADARLSWHVDKAIEVSLVGQNLLQPRHAEFGRDLPPIVQIRRNAYVSLRWQR